MFTTTSMTAANNVYALMLALVIVLSGCFGNTADDTDAQSPEADVNDGETPSTVQDRTWYTSGGTYNNNWDDPNIADDGTYCTGWSSQYDPDTGEQLDDVCDGYVFAEELEEFNASHCESLGGELEDSWTYQGGFGFSSVHHTPECRLNFATINTTAGEVLMVYQLSEYITISTTCNGVTVDSVTPSDVANNEFFIADGGAMDCSSS